MDQDTRSLARQLFARTTILLEKAHEASVAGQSPRITADLGLKRSGELKQIAGEVISLGEAIEVVIGSGTSSRGG